MRVLRPDGRLHLADIALDVELPEDARRNIDLWTGWVAGALPEAELVAYLPSRSALCSVICASGSWVRRQPDQVR